MISFASDIAVFFHTRFVVNVNAQEFTSQRVFTVHMPDGTKKTSIVFVSCLVCLFVWPQMILRSQMKPMESISKIIEQICDTRGIDLDGTCLCLLGGVSRL